MKLLIYENHIHVNCRVKNYLKEDHRSYICNLCSCKKKKREKGSCEKKKKGVNHSNDKERCSAVSLDDLLHV